MSSDFRPTSAVIVGGASGIGLALAKRLVGDGLQVVVGDLPGLALDRVAAIEGLHALPCDAADMAAIDNFAGEACDILGQVDLVFNNAGVSGPKGKVWEVDPERARAHFDINFWGVWHGIRAFAPRLIAQDTPSAIYNTGSENSWFCAVRETLAYIAAKHAVLGLSESLREDLPAHVHAGTIIPGWVFTPLGPERFMKFGMDVEEYVSLILPQILARRRFVVSHGYNKVRIAERVDALNDSFDQYALPPDQDIQHDVQTVMAQWRAAAAQGKDDPKA